MPATVSVKLGGHLNLPAYRIICGCLFTLSAACLISKARADSISLYTPPTAISSAVDIPYSLANYTGQSTYSYISSGNSWSLNLAVDYAVFAPGEVSNSPLGMAGQTDATGTFSIGNFTASSSDYVYAYQIFNTGNSNDINPTGLLGLSIGFNPDLKGTVDDSVGETNATLSSGAVAYNSVYITSDATAFLYTGDPTHPNGLDVGEQSYILLTSSQYSPYYTTSQMLGYASYAVNGGGAVENLSSPNSAIPVANDGAMGTATPLPQAWEQGLFIAAVSLVFVLFARFKRNRFQATLSDAS